MEQKGSTKQRMIEAALDLFHLQGVNATSVDQVLRRSKTGKSQFTHYFKNKDGLIHSVIEFLHLAIQGGLTPTGYSIKNWDDLEGWFQKYIDFQRSVGCKKSCPLGTIGNDLSDEQVLLRQDIKLFLEWSRKELSQFFFDQKAKGNLLSQARPERLADLCISIMQGGMLITKMKRDPDVFENAAQEALNWIRSLRVS